MPALNLADTIAPAGATGVVTLKQPGEQITSGVQYYSSGGTTYKNSQYQVAPPNSGAPVSSSQISNGGALNLPPSSTPDNGSTLVAGAVASAPIPGQSQTPNLDLATSGDLTKDPAYQQALTQYQSSIDQFGQQIQNAPSQADLLAQQQQKTGATADLQTLNSLNTDLANATAQYNQAYQNTETQGIQSGTPAVFYQGEQAAIQRQQAVVVGAKAAQVQAAQGNYSAAEGLAEKTATLQFSDYQNKINNLNQFITLNQQNLSTAEKNATLKMQAQAVFLQQQLDQQKTLRTLALQVGATKPFMLVGSTVVRASDGFQFSSPEQAAAAGVDMQGFSNVQKINPAQVNQKFQQVGIDTSTGNPVYGFVNEATGSVVPLGSSTGSYDATGNSLVSTNPNPNAQIGGYDFTNYAVTDQGQSSPTWGLDVTSILNKIPDVTSLVGGASGPVSLQQQAQTLQTYISKVKSNSPITGQMVMQVASQYGVDPRVMTAVMMKETQLGTDGSKGAKGYNFGNVGNTNTLMASGGSSNFKTPLEGIQAVAQNMAQRVVNQPKNPQQSAFDKYGLLANTNLNLNSSLDKNASLYLDRYLKSGTEPSARTLGLGTKVSLGNIATRATDLYYQATGTAMPNPQMIQGFQGIVKTNNQLINNLNVQEGTVQQNFGLSLKNLNTGNINTAYPILNGIINNLNNAFGDPATAQYLMQNATLQQEAGNLLAVKNASGTTVYDKIAGAGLMPKNATPAQQVAIMNTLLTEAGNASQAIQKANANIYKQIDPLIQDPNNPIITMSKAKGFDYVGALAAGTSYDDIINFLEQQ